MKTISFHIKVLKDLEEIDFSLRKQILELLAQLGDGVRLGMPVSRPMPVVFHGVHELRIFYYLKSESMILVFHFFKKSRRKHLRKKLKRVE